MLDWLIAQYSANEFLVGTTVPFALASAMYAARGFVQSAIYKTKVVFTTHVEINSDNPAFVDTCALVQENVLEKWSNHYRIDEAYSDENNDPVLGIGEGKAYVKLCGKYAVARRERIESASMAIKETLTITFFTPDRRITDKLMRAVQTSTRERRNEVRVYEGQGTWSTRVLAKPHRSFDTIAIPPSVKATLLGAIDQFLASEQKHLERGEPWHLGILLTGDPGGGKSSIIHAIASYLHRDMYLVNESLGLGDFVPRRQLLVIEDIDTTKMLKGEDKDVPISELLNVLDGPLTPHGMITIATTNHVEKLDPALIRKGRFDIQVELLPMLWPEWVEMCALYDHDPGDEATYTPVMAADARKRILFGEDDV